MRVALFITCFNDTLFPQTGQAVVAVLERLGCQVDFSPTQTCCGQMHLNGGYPDDAERLAAKFRRDFDGAEAVVTPSASCAATIKGACPDLAGRVHEFSAFLTEVLGREDVGAYYPHRVTYHDTCSGRRALGLGDGPLRLLRAVKGLDLVEIENPGECCGFGGAFSVKNAAVSTAMLADKMRAVTATGAEVCTAVDNSCLMHIGGGLSRLKAGVRPVHLAEILASTEEAPAP